MPIYDYVYYGAWLAAVIGFIGLLVYVRRRLCDEPYLIVSLLYWGVTLSLLSFVHNWWEQEQWESFVEHHHCRVIEQWSGATVNGEYGKTPYHCDNNFIYWREL